MKCSVFFIFLWMQAGVLEINSYTYSSIPKCYSPMDINAMDAGGISQSYRQPYLKLQGEGVAIAVIDSGIDYTHPVFVKETGAGSLICGIRQ